jgi:hypothetical protein
MDSDFSSEVRQIYASILIVAFSSGSCFVVTQCYIVPTDFMTGCYVVIAGLTLYLAFRNNTQAITRWGRSQLVTMAYVVVMVIITLAWFITTAHNLASVLVSRAAPQKTPNGQVFFNQNDYLENALACLQFLSSDALMVRYAFERLLYPSLILPADLSGLYAIWA